MSGFRVNGQQNQKSGRAMFSALLSPNFMPSLRKIVGAIFEICRYARTHVRTHGAYIIDPRFSNRGPIRNSTMQETQKPLNYSKQVSKANVPVIRSLGG